MSLRMRFFTILATAFISGIVLWFIIDKPPVVIDHQVEQLSSDFGGDFSLMQAKVESLHKEDAGLFGNCSKFDLTKLRGKFVILYFGYTFCPDVCPLGLTNISMALKQLGKDRDQFVPVFITIDPARDTCEQLGLYQTNFDPSFIFLTGSDQEIEKVKVQYRVYAQKEENAKKPENYLVNHSSYVYVLNRQGKFVKNLNHDTPSSEMNRLFVDLLKEEIKQINDKAPLPEQ